MRVDAHPAMLAHMHFKMLLICKTSIANLALDGEPLLSNPLEYLVSRRSKHDWIRGHGAAARTQQRLATATTITSGGPLSVVQVAALAESPGL